MSTEWHQCFTQLEGNDLQIWKALFGERVYAYKYREGRGKTKTNMGQMTKLVIMQVRHLKDLTNEILKSDVSATNFTRQHYPKRILSNVKTTRILIALGWHYPRNKTSHLGEPEAWRVLWLEAWRGSVARQTWRNYRYAGWRYILPCSLSDSVLTGRGDESAYGMWPMARGVYEYLRITFEHNAFVKDNNLHSCILQWLWKQ